MRRQQTRARERLLASLDAYIETKVARRSGRPTDEDDERKPVRYSTLDRAFVVGIVVAAVLVASVVPDAVIESAAVKARYEKVLTWAITILAGLLGASFESAEKLLPLAHRRDVQVAVVSVIVVSLGLLVPFVKADIIVEPRGTRVMVNESLKDFADANKSHVVFREHLKTWHVHLNDSNAQQSRDFPVSPFALLGARLHMTSTWRVAYDVTVRCGQGECPRPSTLRLIMTDGVFDRTFLETPPTRGVDVVSPNTIALRFDTSTVRYPTLLAGTYQARLDGGMCRDKPLAEPLVVPLKREYPISDCE